MIKLYDSLKHQWLQLEISIKYEMLIKAELLDKIE